MMKKIGAKKIYFECVCLKEKLVFLIDAINSGENSFKNNFFLLKMYVRVHNR